MKRCILKGLPVYDEKALAALTGMFEENRGLVLASLPWLVSELIELIGFREALTFVYEQGGRRIYLSGNRHDLSRKFCFDVSEALYQRIAFGVDSSGYVEIPSPWGVSERFRWAMIKSALDKGVSTEDIRRDFGASRRTLTNLRRASADKKRQAERP